MNLRLPAKDAADLIRMAKIEGIEDVYVDAIPASNQDDAETTSVLVTEVTDIVEDYGSNYPTSRSQTVAVNIYYANQMNVKTDLIEKSIESVFLHQNWTLVRSEPHITDPDTWQMTKNYQFTRNERNDY